MYKLSRSRGNEASFKSKAERTTTKNKANRKKQSKSNCLLRGHRGILLTRMDYLLRTHVERTVLLMVNQDRNKDFSVDFCVFVLFVTDF